VGIPLIDTVSVPWPLTMANVLLLNAIAFTFRLTVSAPVPPSMMKLLSTTVCASMSISIVLLSGPPAIWNRLLPKATAFTSRFISSFPAPPLSCMFGLLAIIWAWRSKLIVSFPAAPFSCMSGLLVIVWAWAFRMRMSVPVPPSSTSWFWFSRPANTCIARMSLFASPLMIAWLFCIVSIGLSGVPMFMFRTSLPACPFITNWLVIIRSNVSVLVGVLVTVGIMFMVAKLFPAVPGNTWLTPFMTFWPALATAAFTGMLLVSCKYSICAVLVAVSVAGVGSPSLKVYW